MHKIKKVVADFKATNLYTKEFLTDLEDGLHKSSYVKKKNVVWREGKYYVSWNLDTGVSSFGYTKIEAKTSLQEALELYFEDISIKN